MQGVQTNKEDLNLSHTVHVLGDGVEGTVGAEVERALEVRSGEGVVGHHHDVGLRMRDLTHRFDVHDLQRRVGRRLEPHHLIRREVIIHVH